MTSRRRTRSTGGWSRRSRLLAVCLGLAVVVIFGLSVSLGLRVYELSQEATALRVDNAKLKTALEELQPLHEQLKRDYAALVKGRLPRLQGLAFDRVIPLGHEYVKNIVFTEVKKGQVRAYEYKLVLENDTLYTVWPHLEIHFFDELGIQIGEAVVGDEASPITEDSNSLAPGEVIAYTDSISFDESEHPSYFLVRLFERPEEFLNEEEVQGLLAPDGAG